MKVRMEMKKVAGSAGLFIRKTTGFVWKATVIGLVLLLVTLVVSSITAAEVATETSDLQIRRMMVALLAVNLVDGLILSLVIKHATWRGVSLLFGLALALFGVQTVMGQIEALVFLTPLGKTWGAGNVPVLEMPLELIVSSVVTGAAKAIVAVPVGVWLFGKVGRGRHGVKPRLFPLMSPWQLILKLAAIIFLYEVLYFGFGYYVAWKSPSVLAYYQGTDPGSFLAQMGHVVRQTPMLIPFQAFRALMWTAFALPVVQMLKENRWIGPLSTGLMLAVLGFSHTLVPNPFMPDEVRMIHFIETVRSTFIFGLAQFWLFHRSHRSLRDLVGINERFSVRNRVHST